MKTENDLLKSLKGFDSKKYQVIEHECGEVSFLGKRDSDGTQQPDYATLIITYIPDKTLIELKALKKYKDSLREKLFSYERLTDIVYRDLYDKYEPHALKVFLETKPRGGIKTKIWEGDEERLHKLSG